METSVVIFGSLGLLLFGIAIWVSGLILSDRRSGSADVIRMVLKVAAAVIVPVGVIVGPLIWIFFSFGMNVIPITLSLMLILGMPVFIGSLLSLNWRMSQQHSLLWMLTVAAERKIPLAPSVEAFAEEHVGNYRRKLKLLAARLRSGLPLPNALDQSPDLVPHSSRMMIRVGHQSGVLAEALREVIRLHVDRTPGWVKLGIRTGYLCGIALFALLVLAHMSLTIVPAMERIFYDFEVELPMITEFVSTVCIVISETWYLGIPIFLVLLGLFASLLMYYIHGRGSMFGVSLARRIDAAAIFDALALVVAERRPLAKGVTTMAAMFPRSSVRTKLFWVDRDLRAGVEWTQSFVKHALIQPIDQAVLLAAERVDNLPWVLREMAESNRRRTAYRFDMILQILFPTALILYGTIMLFLVVGYFIPLIKLIECLT